MAAESLANQFEIKGVSRKLKMRLNVMINKYWRLIPEPTNTVPKTEITVTLTTLNIKGSINESGKRYDGQIKFKRDGPKNVAIIATNSTAVTPIEATLNAYLIPSEWFSENSL